MLYLFADASIICKWCSSPWMQVIEDDPSKVIVRLCPVCDRWPEGFMGTGQNVKIEKDW